MNLFDCIRQVFSNYEVGAVYKRKEIITDVVKWFPKYKPGSIIPSDYCYNRNNDGIDFEKWIHVFELIGKGKYKYLGENYPYSGIVMHHPKGGNPYQCGVWENGLFKPYNKDF